MRLRDCIAVSLAAALALAVLHLTAWVSQPPANDQSAEVARLRKLVATLHNLHKHRRETWQGQLNETLRLLRVEPTGVLSNDERNAAREKLPAEEAFQVGAWEEG